MNTTSVYSSLLRRFTHCITRLRVKSSQLFVDKWLQQPLTSTQVLVIMIRTSEAITAKCKQRCRTANSNINAEVNIVSETEHSVFLIHDPF